MTGLHKEKPRHFLSACILALLALGFVSGALSAAAASPPAWVLKRPLSRDAFIGIGMSDKSLDDYRQLAEQAALFDLSSEIAVNVAGTFVATAVERTGLSEQAVKQEIRTFSQARLKGHQRVAEWQDSDTFWVYFRLSKEEYNRRRGLEREKAVGASADMLQRAASARGNGKTVTALRFYFEALAKLQHFIGEHLNVQIDGQSVYLYNQLYADIQHITAGIRLRAARRIVPALVGRPLHEPIRVIADSKTPNGRWRPVSGLPLFFNFSRQASEITGRSVTDANGIAEHRLADIQQNDDGTTIQVRVDVKQFIPQQDIGGFFEAAVHKLSLPSVTLTLKTFVDVDAFFWQNEFLDKKVMVRSAFQTKTGQMRWPKIHDEVARFIRQNGGSMDESVQSDDFAEVFRWAADPQGEWEIDTSSSADLVVLMVAKGKMNRRENAGNPFGEDVQFAGEIQTVVHQNGKPRFSDRYRGATGWNPMGQEMVMDVLALHVFKRWKSMYLKQMRRDG